MQIGNWVPIDKRLAKFLPKTREYSELEAAFSFSIDYDNQKDVTVSGYSKLWGWSRTKVSSFFETMGVEVIYPGDTQKKQKQKGQIKKQKEDRKETEKRQIRFIDSKWLKETKNSKKTEKEQKKDRSKSTTNDPSLNPDPKPIKKETFSPLKNKQEFINNLPESITAKHQMNLILENIERLSDYCLSSGKVYKDYYAALRNFLRSAKPSFKKKETKSLSQIIEERRENQKPDFDIEIKAEA